MILEYLIGLFFSFNDKPLPVPLDEDLFPKFNNTILDEVNKPKDSNLKPIFLNYFPQLSKDPTLINSDCHTDKKDNLEVQVCTEGIFVYFKIDEVLSVGKENYRVVWTNFDTDNLPDVFLKSKDRSIDYYVINSTGQVVAVKWQNSQLSEMGSQVVGPYTIQTPSNNPDIFHIYWKTKDFGTFSKDRYYIVWLKDKDGDRISDLWIIDREGTDSFYIESKSGKPVAYY